MTDKQVIDLTEIDKKYKDKCSLIKAGKCKNVNIFIEQSRKLKAKEQECERLKWYLKEIRMQELSHLDIEWDEYETHCTNTEYSNIINLVEEALEERSPEDCRYGR